MLANHNRCVQHAQEAGDLMLHSDNVLVPTRLNLETVYQRRPEGGLLFSSSGRPHPLHEEAFGPLGHWRDFQAVPLGEWGSLRHGVYSKSVQRIPFR